MDPRIQRLKSLAECQAFARNATERGAPQLAADARLRAVQIRANAHPTTSNVENECLQAVYAYEEVLSTRKGKRTSASRTWQMIRRHGIIPAVERVVTKRDVSSGYSALAEMGLLDLAFEAVVLRHRASFSDEAVAKSRSRLEEK